MSIQEQTMDDDLFVDFTISDVHRVAERLRSVQRNAAKWTAKGAELAVEESIGLFVMAVMEIVNNQIEISRSRVQIAQREQAHRVQRNRHRRARQHAKHRLQAILDERSRVRTLMTRLRAKAFEAGELDMARMIAQTEQKLNLMPVDQWRAAYRTAYENVASSSAETSA